MKAIGLKGRKASRELIFTQMAVSIRVNFPMDTSMGKALIHTSITIGISGSGIMGNSKEKGHIFITIRMFIRGISRTM